VNTTLAISISLSITVLADVQLPDVFGLK